MAHRSLILGLALWCAGPTVPSLVAAPAGQDSPELVQALCELEGAHRSRIARLERLKELARTRSDRKTLLELRSLYELEDEAYQARREALREEHGRARVAQAQEKLGISIVRGRKMDWDLREGNGNPVATIETPTPRPSRPAVSTEGAPGSPMDRAAARKGADDAATKREPGAAARGAHPGADRVRPDNAVNQTPPSRTGERPVVRPGFRPGEVRPGLDPTQQHKGAGAGAAGNRKDRADGAGARDDAARRQQGQDVQRPGTQRQDGQRQDGQRQDGQRQDKIRNRDANDGEARTKGDRGGEARDRRNGGNGAKGGNGGNGGNGGRR